MSDRVKLSGKAFVDGVLYRPSLEEVRTYYSRTEVLDELLGGMQRWHVRLEPGEGLKHRWFNINDRDKLCKTLMRLLDRMSEDNKRVQFPYLRIDGRRYNPVTSWKPNDLWGWDFIIEKDGYTWRPCWDAMVPAIRILDHFDIHYWLKYTGHHSLHVVIPAENFPISWGKVRFADYMRSFGWRLIAFFSRLCFQPLSYGGYEGFGGGAGGTNMPYSLNEHSGLLNYPVRETDIADFEPIKASVSKAEIRSFWREFPDDKRGCATPMIQEILRPFNEQAEKYDGVPFHPPVTLSETLTQITSSRFRERKEAVARLHWFTDSEAMDKVLEALRDRSFYVRKAAVIALVGVDDPRCKKALHSVLENSTPELASWIQHVLKMITDIKILREAQ